MTYHQIATATAAIAAATNRDKHDIALVLGSGLSEYAASLPNAITVPYDRIPGFPVPKVEGHAGSLISADLGGTNAMVLAGRVHYYEGWTLDEVVFGVRTAVASGAGTVVLTNAAGGIGDGLAPGDLVLIRDHLNLTGVNPLMGANDARLGPRFPDLTGLYNAELRLRASETAGRIGIELKEGVYAWLTGPSYETPAEIQMIKRLGGDLVGMSTVPEAIAIRHMGSRVLAISLVTNLAAGISAKPLSHAEVQETAAAARSQFSNLIDNLLPTLIP
jgi:purine-nucleoside phosphorylase